VVRFSCFLLLCVCLCCSEPTLTLHDWGVASRHPYGPSLSGDLASLGPYTPVFCPGLDAFRATSVLAALLFLYRVFHGDFWCFFCRPFFSPPPPPPLSLHPAACRRATFPGAVMFTSQPIFQACGMLPFLAGPLNAWSERSDFSYRFRGFFSCSSFPPTSADALSPSGFFLLPLFF